MPNRATAAASRSEPGPPKRRSSRYDWNTSQRTSADVPRASHDHHTPHALSPQSGPVSRPISPNTTTSSAAATATASAPPGAWPERRRWHRPQTKAARNIAIHGREVEVENLLHQPHRRFVRRADDQHRRGGEHRGQDTGERQEELLHRVRIRTKLHQNAGRGSRARGLAGLAGRRSQVASANSEPRPANREPRSLSHHRLERPQRERHEHDVEQRRASRATALAMAGRRSSAAARPFRGHRR